MSSGIWFSVSSPAGLCLSFISRQGTEAAAGSHSFQMLVKKKKNEWGSKFQKFKRAYGESLSLTLFSQPSSFHLSAPVLPVVSLLPEMLCAHSFPPFFTQMEEHHTNCSVTCFCHLSILETVP